MWTSIVGFFTSNVVLNAFKKVSFFVTVIAIFAFLMTIFVLPNIGLPNGLIEFFKSAAFFNFYVSLEFFMPIADVTACLGFIMALHSLKFLWNIILYFGSLFSNGAN